MNAPRETARDHPDASECSTVESFQHKLEKFELGVVWLDNNNRVTALNGLAREILTVSAGDPIGQEILQFHPAKSRDKIKWLLESSACPHR